MRKLSQINEGMWKSGVNRAKSGELRKEDVTNTNIDKFEEINLGAFCPFYVASQDLTIDDEHKITFTTWKEYREQIRKTGWRMPTYKDWKNIVMEHCKVGVDISDDDSTYNAFLTVNNPFNPRLWFDVDVPRHEAIKYWLDFNDDDENDYGLIAGTFEIYLGSKFRKDVRGVFNATNINEDGVRIRLIKDKKK